MKRDPKSIVANYWACQSCGTPTVAVEVNCGLTPFCIRCPKCGELKAHSAMYPAFNADRNMEINLSATHEFFRPTPKELHALLNENVKRNRKIIKQSGHSKKMFRAECAKHYHHGGLSLRERTDAVPTTHELDALFKARWEKCSGKDIEEFRQLENECRKQLEGGAE